MPFRCVHNCPRNFETSHKASLTHHQAQAYSVQRIAAEHLRATQSNDTKQWIAAHRKFKSMVCHGCHYQCYCQSEHMIQLFPESQVSLYGRIIHWCPHVNGCSISWHWSASHDRARAAHRTVLQSRPYILQLYFYKFSCYPYRKVILKKLDSMVRVKKRVYSRIYGFFAQT